MQISCELSIYNINSDDKFPAASPGLRIISQRGFTTKHCIRFIMLLFKSHVKT